MAGHCFGRSGGACFRVCSVEKEVGDRIGGGFAGAFSPLLTVWRKLHIEVDSMEAVATNGEQKNFEEGSVVAYQENVPALGQSTLGLSIDLIGSDHQYENGRIEIAGYDPTNVVDSIDRWEYFGEVLVNVPDNIVIEGTPGAGVVGQAFRIYDDDDRFLLAIGLPPALPKDEESTNIVQSVRSAFFSASIDLTNASAEQLNPNKRIPFRLNEPAVGVGFVSVFDDVKDLADSRYFWAHTVTFGYQPAGSEDGDPDEEGGGNPLRGGSPETLWGTSQGYSAVFVEPIRDRLFRTYAVSSFTNMTAQPLIRANLHNELLGTTVHEIGHSPGGHTEATDHAEDGLMIEGGAQFDVEKFTPNTVKRFRSAERWQE